MIASQGRSSVLSTAIQITEVLLPGKEVTAADALKLTFEERNPKFGTKEIHHYGRRIDYIYVSEEVRVLDYRTVDTPRPGKSLYPSDHFPVVATLLLP